MAVKNRLHRSELAVPGSNKRMLEKAPDSGADVVFLDLEDAVAPDDKEQARANIIEALQTHGWRILLNRPTARVNKLRGSRLVNRKLMSSLAAIRRRAWIGFISASR